MSINTAINMLVIPVLIILWSILSSAMDCEDAGGKYVRGVFWFECVVVK